jgi:hypothetical protein
MAKKPKWLLTASAGQIRWEDGHVLTEAEAKAYNKEQGPGEAELSNRRYSHKELRAAFEAGAENWHLVDEPEMFTDAFGDMAEELISRRKS